MYQPAEEEVTAKVMESGGVLTREQARAVLISHNKNVPEAEPAPEAVIETDQDEGAEGEPAKKRGRPAKTAE